MKGKAAFFVALLASSAVAEMPLSAIDWLNDPSPVIGPYGPKVARAVPKALEAPISEGVSVPDVTVTEIGAATGREAVGLLAGSVTGLPETLWAASAAEQLAAQIEAADFHKVPVLQELLYTLLLAEAVPPEGTNAEAFLTTRARRLQDFGVIEAAEALVGLLPLQSAAHFGLWFDLTLLAGLEDKACAVLAEKRAISDDYAAQSFCAMRRGDWEEASLLLETAQALGLIERREARLLEAFLDPELSESRVILAPPRNITPLEFRLHEAIGAGLPTTRLPLPFAAADLRDLAGWKAQLAAAERLARVSAISPNVLLALYTDRKPSASGGVWERAQAVQALEAALELRSAEAASEALVTARRLMRAERLDAVFSAIYGPELGGYELSTDAIQARFELALIGKDYERAPAPTKTPLNSFLRGLAKGAPEGAELLSDPMAEAIQAGFGKAQPGSRAEVLLAEGKLGEAILLAAGEVAAGGDGDWPALSRGLAALRKMGLEDVARRVSLQLMLLKEIR